MTSDVRYLPFSCVSFEEYGKWRGYRIPMNTMLLVSDSHPSAIATSNPVPICALRFLPKKAAIARTLIWEINQSDPSTQQFRGVINQDEQPIGFELTSGEFTIQFGLYRCEDKRQNLSPSPINKINCVKPFQTATVWSDTTNDEKELILTTVRDEINKQRITVQQNDNAPKEQQKKTAFFAINVYGVNTKECKQAFEKTRWITTDFIFLEHPLYDRYHIESFRNPYVEETTTGQVIPIGKMVIGQTKTEVQRQTKGLSRGTAYGISSERDGQAKGMSRGLSPAPATTRQSKGRSGRRHRSDDEDGCESRVKESLRGGANLDDLQDKSSDLDDLEMLGGEGGPTRSVGYLFESSSSSSSSRSYGHRPPSAPMDVVNQTYAANITHGNKVTVESRHEDVEINYELVSGVCYIGLSVLLEDESTQKRTQFKLINEDEEYRILKCCIEKQRYEQIWNRIKQHLPPPKIYISEECCICKEKEIPKTNPFSRILTCSHKCLHTDCYNPILLSCPICRSTICAVVVDKE